MQVERLIHLFDFGVDLNDDFVAISEDNEENDEKPKETSTNKAVTSAEFNEANSTVAAVSYAGSLVQQDLLYQW